MTPNFPIIVIDNEFSIKYLTSICKSKNQKINVLIDCDIIMQTRIPATNPSINRTILIQQPELKLDQMRALLRTQTDCSTLD